jgi:hypothetical protein
MKLWKHPTLPENVIVLIIRERGYRVWGVGPFRGAVEHCYYNAWGWRAWNVVRLRGGFDTTERGVEGTMRDATAKCLAALRRMAGLEEPCS